MILHGAGGRKVLYTGIRPTLIRAFPANAAQWLAWEITLRWGALSGSAYADILLARKTGAGHLILCSELAKECK